MNSSLSKRIMGGMDRLVGAGEDGTRLPGGHIKRKLRRGNESVNAVPPVSVQEAQMGDITCVNM